MSVRVLRLYDAKDTATGLAIATNSGNTVRISRALRNKGGGQDYDYCIDLTWDEAYAAKQLLTEILTARQEEEGNA